MKVGVITMHSVYNYGTQLQLLATQEKLKEYFDDVEFIDYRRENTYGKGLIKEYSKNNIIRFLAFMPTYYKWNKVFRRFQNKYINITKKQYKDDNIELLNEKYDVFITGSDQVWNAGWNNGIIGSYYLNFVNNKPKYSYSSSFGIDKLNKDNIKEIKDYLSKYKRISVREKTGLKILNNQLKINNAIQILDPTLAYSKDFWKKYSTKRKIKEKYILVYNLNNNKDLDILVIDNNSNDGTQKMINKNFPKISYKNTGKNLGGAGGFNYGIKEAFKLRKHYEYLWIMDDDTIPKPNVLSTFLDISKK